ncbi:hypothetical protein Golax_024595 [Gossypium laxum]|uniref:Aminotransferase-like plant mobile domain-containing protein n=1 Tax=Gossypium laxum TaxID=34288 RepID=A0A7J8ZCI8_9ROSI|nr:hypothetical protein [Gossypium laxum]
MKAGDAHVLSPYGECTITLEYVSLQLGLLVDRDVVTELVVSVDWSATCEELPGNVEQEQFTHSFILRLIGGLLMLDKSRNLVHLRWLILLVGLREVGRFNWGSAVLATLYRETWNNLARHSGIPTKLEDIRLALDQQTEDEFVWMPYANPRIQECLLDEFLANHRIWHVKVPLIMFATVEIHEFNRVIQQFECTLYSAATLEAR